MEGEKKAHFCVKSVLPQGFPVKTAVPDFTPRDSPAAGKNRKNFQKIVFAKKENLDESCFLVQNVTRYDLKIAILGHA